MNAIEEVYDATREQALEAVRVALVNGRILHSGPWSAGPYRTIKLAPNGPYGFDYAVLHHTPGTVPNPIPGEVHDSDWWVIAEAFVDRVGVVAAMRAAELHNVGRA